MQVEYYDDDYTYRQSRGIPPQIRQWVITSLKQSCDFIPIYIPKKGGGIDIEDCTNKTKIKVSYAP